MPPRPASVTGRRRRPPAPAAGAARAPVRVQPGRRARGRTEHGFTLVELALVLLITAILLTLALPRLPRIGSAQLDASADRLATLTTYLADESSLRGRIYRLSLDLDDDSWEVQTLRPWNEPGPEGESAARGQPQREWDDTARGGRLPDGVFFEGFTDSEGRRATGSCAIWFLPEGSPDDATLELAEAGGRRLEVVYDAAGGRARVEPGETRR